MSQSVGFRICKKIIGIQQHLDSDSNCVTTLYLPQHKPHHHHNHFMPFSGTTRVSRCQKRTSGLYGAREETPITRVPCSNAANKQNPLKCAGVPQTGNRSQSLVGRSSPYCKDMWERYCCLTGFSDCRYVP